ncbi:MULTISPECIES: phage head closure protein [unclassified Stenotrophomonas]|uniref:phage head closure protein n=1 Tax=unclassified Stenotrophomonas TaxID=196198 RepID=UPI00244A7EF2|nr:MULTISPECIES: phage head closure protein [unclassified Stenotrophomonas]MBN5158841.1 phage head closure protein [Stenotrophomonas maltophilia]MDG9843757.1 phage head closure protein [Stenotrophomonas sp. GD04054]MDH0016103.1 phage head closure protein [Stenotrophomonas sp. GD04028]MDH0577458.1 phage head closure protein [Stenotrophomonas sp. GD03997]MDH0859432.1 phage head closure protein [Stenotrophomonas sp. GD03882]
MSLPAGKLRHRVLIQQQMTTKDEDGVQTTTWVDMATVWASVEPLSAREFIQSGQTQSAVAARITMRYRDGLSPSMRLIHRGEIFNIAGLLPDKVSGLEYITIPVSAGVNDGQ